MVEFIVLRKKWLYTKTSTVKFEILRPFMPLKTDLDQHELKVCVSRKHVVNPGLGGGGGGGGGGE